MTTLELSQEKIATLMKDRENFIAVAEETFNKEIGVSRTTQYKAVKYMSCAKTDDTLDNEINIFTDRMIFDLTKTIVKDSLEKEVEAPLKDQNMLLLNYVILGSNFVKYHPHADRIMFVHDKHMANKIITIGSVNPRLFNTSVVKVSRQDNSVDIAICVYVYSGDINKIQVSSN